MKFDVIYNEECLAGMQRLPDASVDMILCDLPYGTTDNPWDVIIDLPSMWAQYKRIIRRGGAIVLTAQAPFDKVLATSNLKWFRHEWIWHKSMATGHLNAKRAPMKAHETVLVFCEKGAPYYPQGLTRLAQPIHCSKNKRSTNYDRHERPYVQEFSNYPRTILQFPDGRSGMKGFHPTQKPVALFEYLIRTYSEPGAVVLDNCIGSGTTAVAAINTGRRYVGFEQDRKYFVAALDRIENLHPATQLLAA